MGVYIKDMEMPETCEDCQFHRYHSHHEFVCVATPLFYPMNLANSEGIRKDWCPLVEVPENHGRLIDADALMNIFADRLAKVSERYGINSAVAGAVSGAMKLLDLQPTVIEAEGE